MTNRLVPLALAPIFLAGSAVVAAPVRVFIELTSPGTVAAALSATSTEGDRLAAAEITRPLASRLRAEQDELMATLRTAGLVGDELFRAHRVLNGVAVSVEESDLATLSALPGVKSVHRLRPKYMSNSSSVPFVGAPTVWNPQGPNVTGTGVSIAIIDTGIDYIHKSFGGTGSYSGQRFDDAQVPWTSSVVGGYDFVGDDYTGSNTPKPDPDPMDCHGHGSHVAGSAAGLGLDGDGNTYRGAYSPSMGLGTFRLGPGVAPGAKLYALRVFGCEGGTEMVIPAIEWALDPNGDDDLADHLDVLNLSLGTDFGDPSDPDVQAVDQAVAAGIAVAAAAGNAGDGYFIGSSPAAADGAVSVASVSDAGVIDYTLTVNQPAGLGTTRAYAARFGPPLSATSLTSDLVRANPARGCTAFANASSVAGKIAFIDRGDCLFTVKVRNAQLAGAIAAVIANNERGVILMAGDDPTIDIPAVSISGEDGSTIRAKLPLPGVNVTLTKYAWADVVSDFSSRGPRLGDCALKPDLAAPGDAITSVYAGSGDDLYTASGTSMATPHVAGALALLRQLHPTWPVHWLKAALMNTSVPAVYTKPNLGPPTVGPGRVGAGRIDLGRAAATTLLAFDDEHPTRVSVSFGRLDVLGHTVAERRIRLVNTGADAVQVTLAVQPTVDMPGVELTLPAGTELAVPGGSEVTVVLRLVADASKMQRTLDPGASRTSGTDPRQWLAEEAGLVTVTPAGGSPIVLPYHAAPRPVSAMTGAHMYPAGNGLVQVGLLGIGTATDAAYPEGVVPLVSAFELAYTSPDEETTTGRSDMADLRYVGVATDYPAQVAAGKGLADSRIYFAVVSQQEWATPAEVRFDVEIDTNRDGKNEYLATTTLLPDSNDVFAASVCRTSSQPSCTLFHLNGVAPDVRDTALFGSNVMIIPVPANLDGLSVLSTRFNYRVRTYLAGSGEIVDETPVLTFEVAKPGLAFGGIGLFGTAPTLPMYEDLPGRTITATFDAAAYEANASQGLLLLHHHNLPGQRAQVLALGSGGCALTCSASVPSWVQTDSSASFAATVATSGCQTPTVSWTFGDGGSGTGEAASHAFATPGTYTWTLAVQAGAFTCHRAGTLDVSDTAPRLPRRRLTGS
ncbi:MAG: S8 family serine peptidase [Thermoanaerobaculaceae bacterium]|nr:S8 family serine peptidase [Thermoanaerobaculaceae bacterium]MDI9622114.1 S8 family serine peptidase [Acidobacteriota bacterium]NLH11600.1 S8 family serine peptidase [Holophagae bacterium]HPW56643.1 S8 family serine peptidase [Thermoanaerobaculaceae bacterium]